MADKTTNKTGFLAGAAQVDISPAAGMHLSGDVGRYRPAEVLLDEIYAKAVVIKARHKQLCIISLDVTIICAEYTEQIRDGVCALGFERDAVMVHATQTHSAPGVGRFMADDDFGGIPPGKEWIGGGEPEYSSLVVNRAIESAKRALDSIKPVHIGASSGIEGRLAFNRRAVRKDGTVGMPGSFWETPVGPNWIKYLEGPIDPELGIICLQDMDLNMLSIISHYTCHPVHVFTKGRSVSADWPGSLSDQMQTQHGRSCVPLVLNGCCGNINPWDPFDPEYPNDHIRMGKMIAQTANKIIEKMQFNENPVLDWIVEKIPLQIKEVPQDLLCWAEGILEQNPQPHWTDDTQSAVDWDWMRAVSIKSVSLMKQREPEFMYEIQVFRIGEIAIVGLPGEPFVEGQLAIKSLSKAKLTYVAHCCTHYIGYLPTESAYPRGGHEVDLSYWAKIEKGSLEQVVEKSVQMIDSLF